MKSVCLSVLLIISCLWATSQSITGHKLMMTPSGFLFPTGDEQLENNPGIREDTKNLWVVFSDRDNNQTYTTPGGKTTLQTVKFLQPFFVLEAKNNYLHIVKYTNEIDNYLKNYSLTKNLDDYGWIEKGKLLLWTHCLVDPNTKYFLKGLTINPMRNQEEIKDYVNNPHQLKFYNDADLTKVNKTENRLFDFLFIYKKSGNSYLIANKTKFTSPVFTADKEAPRVLLGWVSKAFIKEWGQRVTLEPNSDGAAANERAKKKIKTTVFIDSTNALNFAATGSIDENKIFWNDDPGSVPMKAELKRFPILNDNIDNMQNAIIHTGVQTAIFNSGKVVITTDQQADILRKYNGLRENMRNVNIVFVIDGTDRIKDFKANISEMMLNMVNKIEALNEQNDEETFTATNKYRMGMVVYRDDATKHCPPDYNAFDKYDLTNDLPQIQDKFNNVVRLTSCNEGESYRAVYKAIDAACRMFQGKETQSNIIFLIGAGGNLKDNVYKSQIARELYQYSVGLLAFQIKHPLIQAQAYSDFTDQISDVLKSETQMYQDTLNNMPFNRKKSGPVSFDIIDMKNNLLKFDCPNKRPLPGEILFSDANVTITPQQLESEVTSAFDSLRESKEAMYDAMDYWLFGQGVRKDINEGMMALLSKMNVDPELLRRSADRNNYQLFVDGYISMNCNQLNNKLFNFCVFLSRSELDNLISVLSNIVSVGNNSDKDNRKNMYDGMVKEVQEYYGDREAREMIKKIDIDVLISHITGVQTSNSLFKNHKIKDIENSKKITPAEFTKMENSIATALLDLETYRDTEGNSYASTKEEHFYWVPQKLFP